MSPVTMALGVLAVGALVYALGVERTGEAASTAGGAASRAAQSSATAGLAGLGIGLQFGNDLLTAILAEPGFALAGVAGIFGSLGTAGFLGDVSGAQFLLGGLVLFGVGYAVLGGDD